MTPSEVYKPPVPQNQVFPPIPAEESPQSWGWFTLPSRAICVFIPWKKRRKETTIYLIILTIAILVFASGCGVKTMYGTISGEYEFSKVEYPEKDYSYPPKNDILWTFPAKLVRSPMIYS